MARKFTASQKRASQQPHGRSAVLTTKERAFVEATVLGAPSLNAAAAIAGYSDPKAHAHEIAARPIVAAAIEDRRSAAMREANVNLAEVYTELVFAAKDRSPDVRSSQVRAGEILLRAAGELQPDIRVSVDNRSVVLGGVDAGRAAQVYAAMFGEPAAARAADGGPGGAGG